MIRKAKQSDIGLYKCEAKNYLGSAYATTRVILPKVTPPTTTVSTIIKEPVGKFVFAKSYCPNKTCWNIF